MNENADPDVIRDLIYGFEKVYPTDDRNYKIRGLLGPLKYP